MTYLEDPILTVVKSPRKKEPFYMKMAYATGYTAYYIVRFIRSWFFRIVFSLAIAYFIIRLAGISIVIMKAGIILLKIC